MSGVGEGYLGLVRGISGVGEGISGVGEGYLGYNGDIRDVTPSVWHISIHPLSSRALLVVAPVKLAIVTS